MPFTGRSSTLIDFIKTYIEKYRDMELQDKLSIVFISTGILLSGIGYIYSLVFSHDLWMSLPHLFVVLYSIFVAYYFRNDLSKVTVKTLYMIGYLYMPYTYFTNGGISGGAHLYFILIVLYYTFYFDGKDLVIRSSALALFYVVIIWISFINPQLVIPYTNDLSKHVDTIIAMASVSAFVSFSSYEAFSDYKKEKRHVYELVETLKEKNKELEKLSYFDSLTNIYNRRYFMKLLEDRFNKAISCSESRCLFMIDIDFFKNVNDTYGHIYGDEVIRNTAQIIEACLGKNDILGRYGGEEFVVYTSCEESEYGFEMAEKIRDRVEKTQYSHGENLTVSIGVSSFKKEDTVESVFYRADNLLYRAKSNGRNRVEYEEYN
jgi:diguanylate cyclase (GGDEF)-like protein